MRGLTARLVALVLVLCVAGTAQAATLPVGEKAPVLPARVKDADGRTVVVRDTRRIVVLNGDLAEVVYALGLGGRVVGTDQSATYPAAAARLQNIGYQRTLSAEGIISLRPTLVIGNTAAGPSAVIRQIRDAGITTVILPDDDRLSAAWTKTANVARALGVPRRGARLAAITRTQVTAARKKLAGVTTQPKVAYLYVRGSRTQLIGGTGSRGDVMIQAAGGIDVGSRLGIEGLRPITSEAMVAAQPGVILVPSAGVASVGGIDGVLKLPGVGLTPAGKAKRILAFDDGYLLGLGPRTGAAVRDLIAALHDR